MNIANCVPTLTVRAISVHYFFSPWFEKKGRAILCWFSSFKINYFSPSCQVRRKSCSFSRISTSHCGKCVFDIHAQRADIYSLELASVSPCNDTYFRSSYLLICGETFHHVRSPLRGNRFKLHSLALFSIRLQ